MPKTAEGSGPDCFIAAATSHNFAQAHAREIIGKLNHKGHNGELMRPMLEVRQEYLDAAFSAIHERYLNLENYVYCELTAEPELLRARFLE